MDMSTFSPTAGISHDMVAMMLNLSAGMSWQGLQGRAQGTWTAAADQRRLTQRADTLPQLTSRSP